MEVKEKASFKEVFIYLGQMLLFEKIVRVEIAGSRKKMLGITNRKSNVWNLGHTNYL